MRHHKIGVVFIDKNNNFEFNKPKKVIPFALLDRGKIVKVLPRFELGSLDSESKVLTITP